MPPERSSDTQSSERESDVVITECAICGTTDSLSTYSIAQSSRDSTTIGLCPTHYQVAAILSGARFQESDVATDYDLQETRKITVRVPRALIESADAAAERQGQTRSEFVRDGLQMAIELQEMESAFDDIVTQAVHAEDGTGPAADVEFLKERIRTLESLLEDSIDKL
ncbi:Ribbon-helix-helix protein, copG family [Natrinema salifodinae]|uniref:Ribbon-helix-helix protein, copG family n=2 Tax=Natrinema salifodinae TaxID=1202768 RepID=A0A1I0QRP8_9EURY|nr:Ribbon-helix-helix protein, copG family [Natrinema salifodinae]